MRSLSKRGSGACPPQGCSPPPLSPALADGPTLPMQSPLGLAAGRHCGNSHQAVRAHRTPWQGLLPRADPTANRLCGPGEARAPPGGGEQPAQARGPCGIQVTGKSWGQSARLPASPHPVLTPAPPVTPVSLPTAAEARGTQVGKRGRDLARGPRAGLGRGSLGVHRLR